MQVRITGKAITQTKVNNPFINPFIKAIIAFLRKIPVDRLGECKNAVDWIIRGWTGPGKMQAYTGGFFKKGNLCFLNRTDATCEYHTVAVLKLPNAHYIVDATIQQFTPNVKMQIVKVAPNEAGLIGILQNIYGGRWFNL